MCSPRFPQAPRSSTVFTFSHVTHVYVKIYCVFSTNVDNIETGKDKYLTNKSFNHIYNNFIDNFFGDLTLLVCKKQKLYENVFSYLNLIKVDMIPL